MHVTVKLFASFRNGRFKIDNHDVPDGTNVAYIVRFLQIPESELGVALVNGRHASLRQPLCGGDILSLFPLVGGG
jgi:molybdopterin converting factor small subunit